jgi:two-component system sensor histidine kinase MtrB
VKRPSFALRHRTTAAFALLALLVSASVALVSYELTRSTLISQRENVALRQTFLNARAARAALASEPDAPAKALLRVQTAGGGLALLRVHGEWFSTSVSAGRDDVPASLRASLAAGAVAHQRTTNTNGSAVAVGVPIGGLDASYVEFVPLTEVDRTLQRVASGLMLAAAGATILGALVGRWMTRRVLRPVRRTAEAADGIREGALDRRLEAEHDADLEPLTRSFNAMVDSLQARIEREQRFASDVSHELRSPLATMDAALSVARRRVSEPAANAALDALEGEVARFRELIVDLLEIARSEAGVAELRLEEINPSTLAESVLASTHRHTVQLIIEPSAPTRVQLDKRRLGQALVNLLDNADNYAGGAVRLVVSGDEDHVRFVVDDDGPGIPEHEREHVFGRFSRGANAEVAGTGLGLALVAEHVRRHQGTVAITDADHGGARFVIEIPRHPA